MKRYLFIYFLITLAISINAQQLTQQEELFVDSVMKANYKPNEPGAVLLIAKKGQPVFRKSYGLASLELNVSNKPEYVFRIASMTKQFTAVCVLKLAQEGKLNLDDDIKRYLPDYNSHGRHITIENLLNHTNGIPDFTEKNEFIARSVLSQSPEELKNSFMNDSLTFEPGTSWGYSSSGYVVAGLIVEKVSGMPLNEYMQQNIFKPLEMFHTSVGTSDSIIKDAVNGYDNAGGKFISRYTNWSWMYAAGDIVSNVDDLLKWDNALYNEKIIKKEWMEKAWKPFVLPNGQTTNYGLGWNSNYSHGIQFIEHAGGTVGFCSDGIRVPSQQLYIVILSNKPYLWPAQLMSSIVLRMVEKNITKPPIKSLDKNALERYAGVYAINYSFYAKPVGEQQYQYFTISGDTLIAQNPGYSKGPLLNVGKDLFIPTWWENSYYQFHRNKEGGIVSVELFNEPIQNGPHQVNLKTNLPLPKDKQAITLEANQLEALKGKYDFGGGFILAVTVEGNKIYLQMPEKEEFFAENETNFFSKKTDITIEFTLNNKVVSGIKVKVQGEVHEGKKIE